MTKSEKEEGEQKGVKRGKRRIEWGENVKEKNVIDGDEERGEKEEMGRPKMDMVEKRKVSTVHGRNRRLVNKKKGME